MNVVADTTPYDWPFDADLDPGRLALIVAGADSHWVAHAMTPPTLMMDLRTRVAELTAIGVVVVAVWHRTPGSDGMPVQFPAATHLMAHGVDGFYGSRLDDELRQRGRDQLALAGFGLEGPIHSTLRTANDMGYECLTLADLCAPVADDTAKEALSSIQMSGGIFGAVGTSANLAAALARPPLHEET